MPTIDTSTSLNRVQIPPLSEACGRCVLSFCCSGNNAETPPSDSLKACLHNMSTNFNELISKLKDVEGPAELYLKFLVKKIDNLIEMLNNEGTKFKINQDEYLEFKKPKFLELIEIIFLAFNKFKIDENQAKLLAGCCVISDQQVGSLDIIPEILTDQNNFSRIGNTIRLLEDEFIETALLRVNDQSGI